MTQKPLKTFSICELDEANNWIFKRTEIASTPAAAIEAKLSKFSTPYKKHKRVWKKRARSNKKVGVIEGPVQLSRGAALPAELYEKIIYYYMVGNFFQEPRGTKRLDARYLGDSLFMALSVGKVPLSLWKVKEKELGSQGSRKSLLAFRSARPVGLRKTHSNSSSFFFSYSLFHRHRQSWRCFLFIFCMCSGIHFVTCIL